MERYIADRITVDPDKINGKPAIRGHRISVQTVLEYLAAGEEPAEILYQFPFLEPEDLLACQAFAVKLIAAETEANRWVEPITDEQKVPH